MSLFNAKDAQGNFIYGDDEVLAFVPYLIVAAGAAAEDVVKVPAVHTLLTRFAEDAELKAGLSNEEAQQAIDAYYETNPLNPKLKQELESLLRELRIDASPDALARKSMDLIGSTPTRPKQTPPPEGAVSSNPPSRFELLKKFEED